MTGLNPGRSPAQDIAAIYRGLEVLGERRPLVGPDGLEQRQDGLGEARTDVRRVTEALSDMVLSGSMTPGATLLEEVNDQIGSLDEDPERNPGRRHRAAMVLFNALELGTALEAAALGT